MRRQDNRPRMEMRDGESGGGIRNAKKKERGRKWTTGEERAETIM